MQRAEKTWIQHLLAVTVCIYNCLSPLTVGQETLVRAYTTTEAIFFFRKTVIIYGPIYQANVYNALEFLKYH